MMQRPQYPVRTLVLQALVVLSILAILSPLALRCRQRLYVAGGSARWDELGEPDPSRPVVGLTVYGCWVGRGVYEEQSAVTDHEGHFLFASPPFWAAPGARPLQFYVIGQTYRGRTTTGPPWAVHTANGWALRTQDQERLFHSERAALSDLAKREAGIMERRARKGGRD